MKDSILPRRAARLIILSAVVGTHFARAVNPSLNFDGPSASPQQRRGPSTNAGRVFKAQITPHWFQNDTRFWYRSDLRGGAREFILVDAEKGTRQPAFDHRKLAVALSKAAAREYKSEQLPFDSIEFIDDGKALRFEAADKTWRCVLSSYECAEVKGSPAAALPSPRPQAVEQLSRVESVSDGVLFDAGATFPLTPALSPGERENRQSVVRLSEAFRPVTTPESILPLPWGEGRGEGEQNIRLSAGSSQFSAANEPPSFALDDDEALSPPQPAQQQQRPVGQARGQRGGLAAGQGEPARSVSSPDGKWTAFVKDHNVFVRAGDQETQLSTDGRTNNSYGRLEWSPDSRTLVGWRIEPGDRKEVYLIQSTPPGGGRAVLQTRAYDLPGDKFTAYELSLFDVAKREQIKPEIERVDFGSPRPCWNKEGQHFTFQKTDRGHQRFRVIEIEARTGAARHLIDEKTDTFIWTAHTENVNLTFVNWLEKTDEILYASESNGWRHLYLIDAAAGKLKSQITKGEWIVRGIDRIDEEKRQVWFRASGVYPKQDPYLIHYGHVNFDGSELVFMTAGHGNHSVAYSPDRKFVIDTFSRVDLPAVNELRRVSDGKLVCELEKADVSEAGWEPPEVFVAKSRDGKTDIWGLISRPRDFDPNKKYPVIEQIYAGPQGSYVPKTFSTARRFAALNELGFIVVQMDGMGTANRSKAFHDVCWKNLKDAGFPDRILWHQAAAKKYPSYDLSRVGIYGTSAGGQNAAGAVLFHPEFYKAAVANCGCHDNRMDKASWNEQWMGYPVGPQYSESSNIDNAGLLQGHLMLVVGELDNNVPPESTYRFVDALIKANKDFDFLVVPGGGHGSGGAYGQRRLQDFFVRHLQGVEPPNRNAKSRTDG